MGGRIQTNDGEVNCVERMKSARKLEGDREKDVPDWPKIGPSQLIGTCLSLICRIFRETTADHPFVPVLCSP